MVTLKDVALRAGVDVSTVSRALSGDREINTETRERIKKIAAEMGYERKLRQVRSGKIPGLIGVIIPEILSGYYSAMLDRINAALLKSGKTSLLGITDFEAERAHQYITGFAKAGAEGLVYIMDACEPPLKAGTGRLLHTCGIPVAFINGSFRQNPEFDSVYVDDLAGARKAVGHLIELGHKSIGFIGENRTTGRADVCRTVLEEKGLGLPPEFCRVGTERLEQGGYLRMKELLSEKVSPTAVFVAYDQMAVGAIRALNEAGYSVPGDISIVGFDNISAAEYILGGLTTVATPMEDAAAITVRLLIDRIEAPRKIAVRHITVQPALIIRGSTAPLRQ